MLELNKHLPQDPDHFEFDDEVSSVFDDMAMRSIPGYSETFDMVGNLLSRTVLSDYTQVWDLGCSTGAGLECVYNANVNPLVSFHGVDTSAAMLALVAEKVAHTALYQHDLTTGLPEEFAFGEVSVVLMNWTLQFIEDHDVRRSLIKDCYDGLCPGGYMFISEKFRLPDRDLDASAQASYLWWRRMNGYSLEEIRAKSRALKNSMWPWTTDDLLSAINVGCPDADVQWLYRLYNFGGVLVRKPGFRSE